MKDLIQLKWAVRMNGHESVAPDGFIVPFADGQIVQVWLPNGQVRDAVACIGSSTEAVLMFDFHPLFDAAWLSATFGAEMAEQADERR